MESVWCHDPGMRALVDHCFTVRCLPKVKKKLLIRENSQPMFILEIPVMFIACNRIVLVDILVVKTDVHLHE